RCPTAGAAVGFGTLILPPFRAIGNLLFPMFSRPSLAAPEGGGRRVGTVLKWVLHILLIGLILVGLFFLGRWLRLERHIRVSSLWLREAWLPLLFLLFYVLCWLARSLWKLLGPEQIGADHPDIDQAWDEGLMALS